MIPQATTPAKNAAGADPLFIDTTSVDRKHLWHPYSPPGTLNLEITHTDGVYLYDAAGTELVDAMSSWWSAVHGHGHPHLVEAATKQITSMSHVMFGGITHEPAARLCTQLIALTGGGLPHVFFSDSGSVSVEVAIKMAMQYSGGIGHPERKRLLTWKSGYHGDTFETMSVSDPDTGMHSMWSGLIPQQVFAPAPPVRGSSAADRDTYLAQMESLIDPTIAAIIIEPIVQGAGGMRFHDAELVAGVRRICDRHGILLIADEIATGFGRTGQLFATLSNGITPDILCVGKALTGGFISLAATLCTAEVAAAIASPAGGGALMHGPTFMGNPLACAVASASLDLIATGAWEQQVPACQSALAAGLSGLSSVSGVRDVRVLGAIGVVEMEQPVDIPAATMAARGQGVWIRPFGRLIYVMPPYISTAENLQRICAGVGAAICAAAERIQS